MSPRLALSIGCPAGIGAEVALLALSHPEATKTYTAVAFGDVQLLRERARVVGLDPNRIVTVPDVEAASSVARDAIPVVQVGPPLDAEARTPGRPHPVGGAAQLAYIADACDAVVRGEADALVTAPVSKKAIASSGAPGAERFLGHTEWLGDRLHAEETVMAFVANALTITLATTHLPLSEVSARLRSEDVARAAYWTVRLCDDLAMDPSLATAVLSLNPHAGEQGLLGREEEDVIGPGIVRARARLDAENRHRALRGPLPAESALRQAVRDRAYAACVAMYHDQATIPSKLVAFGDAVNVTLGLPIVRTSVDHGTAYDLAGTGRADAAGMRSALALAARLSAHREHGK